MPKLVQVVEQFFEGAASTIEADLEAGWAELKPAITALGKTVLGQVAAAAETLLANPSATGFADALASIVGQLPADAKTLETALAGALATQVAKLMGTAPAAAPTPPAA